MDRDIRRWSSMIFALLFALVSWISVIPFPTRAHGEFEKFPLYLLSIHLAGFFFSFLDVDNLGDLLRGDIRLWLSMKKRKSRYFPDILFNYENEAISKQTYLSLFVTEG